MVDINSTLEYINQIPIYASIIGAIVGSAIAAATGIYLTNYKEKIVSRERQRIVAKALYDEMSSFYDRFAYLFEDYSTKRFDEVYFDGESDDPEDYQPMHEFEVLALDQIANLGLGSRGASAFFLQEKTAYSTFYEDIFQFNNDEVIDEIIEFYRTLNIADRYYRNYFIVDEKPTRYLRNFFESIEFAYSLLCGGSALDYLEKTSRKGKSWNDKFQHFKSQFTIKK